VDLDHRKFLEGDPAMTEAFCKTARWWIRRRFHKPSQIEAVVQDTMVEMLTKLAAGDEPDPHRVEEWILNCANNATRREQTRARRNLTVPYESQLHARDQATLSELHRYRADLEQVDALLEGCKERLTRMFFLRVQGYAYDEIAQEVGANSGAIRMALHRLRQRLERELLADDQLDLGIPPTTHHDESSSARA
jgi:RNA polymerase sigma factor (sigma-70 family)